MNRLMGAIQLQGIIDLNVIARRVISEYFPEFSSCYLTTEFRHIEGSISEVHHTYPFEDNEYKGEIIIIIDDSMRLSGVNAILGAIAHDIAHRVGWEGPGYPLISNREADNIVIERGLCSYLLETKKALEELRPELVIDGYSSKEMREILNGNYEPLF
ncbi:hypothetical protein ACFLUX_02795 [Chloroflexota bacterium]